MKKDIWPLIICIKRWTGGIGHWEQGKTDSSILNLNYPLCFGMMITLFPEKYNASRHYICSRNPQMALKSFE